MKNKNTAAFVKDNTIVFFGMTLLSLKAIILMPIIIKTLGVTVYGGYVLLISMAGIVSGVSSFGVGIRAKRHLPSCESFADRSRVYYPQLIFGLFSIIVISLTMIVLHQQINSLLFDNSISYSIYVIPAYLFSYFFYSQGSDYFRYTSRIYLMTIIITAYPYINIGLIFLLLFVFDLISLNTLILSEAISTGLMGILSFKIIFKEIGAKATFYKWREFLAELKLGVPIMFNVVIDFILAASDRYLISFFLSLTAVGYYNPAYLLGSLGMLIPKTVSMVIPQLMSKAIDNNDQETANNILNYTIKLFLLVAIPLCFAALVLSKEILIMLANVDVAHEAHIIVPIVAIGTVFYGLIYIMSNALFVQLKTAVMLKVNMFSALINLALNVVFLFIFRDIVVAALSTLASYLLSFVYLKVKMKYIWEVTFDKLYLFKVLAASVVMWGVLVLLVSISTKGFSFLSFMLFVLGPMSVYLGLLVLMKAFSRQEVDLIRGTIYVVPEDRMAL